MRYKGVRAAKFFSVILAAAMFIENTQTACAYTQAAFDVGEEEILLLEDDSSEAGELSREEQDVGESEEIEITRNAEFEEYETDNDDDEIVLIEEDVSGGDFDTPVSDIVTLNPVMQEAAEEFILTEEEIEVKEDLADNDVLSDLLEMEEGTDYVRDQVIALAESGQEAELIARAYGGELVDFSYGLATISLADSDLSVVEAFEIGIDPDVNIPAVEPDYMLSFDDFEEEEYAEFNDWINQYTVEGHNDPLLNPASSKYQWHHEILGSYDAWDVTLGSSDIVVAIIDSGVQTDHEDLKDAIVDNYEQVNAETAQNGLNSSNEDGYGHGTHVAGLVAASIGNDKGGAGVAPGVRILPINVCRPEKPGSPVISYMVKAIQYASGAVDAYAGDDKTIYYSQRRADIINMSIGSNTYNSAMKKAIDAAYAQGVTVVAAMGNDGTNLVKYPAKYDHVIGVCATRKDNTLADFSDYGEWADISAPGAAIFSTIMGSGDAYDKKDGTSMASPIVAGACALYMSYKGHVSPDSMESALKRAATKTSQRYCGAGIVNVAAMLGRKSSADKPGSANLPIKTITLNKTALTLSSPAAGIAEQANLSVTKLITSENKDILELGYENCANLKWTSSNTNVVKITGKSSGMGVTGVTIIPVSTGTATITCQVQDKAARKATCKVTVVSDKAITDISLYSFSDSTYIQKDPAGRIKTVTLFKGASSVGEESDEEIIVIDEDRKTSDIVLKAEQSTKYGDFDDDIKAPLFKNNNPKAVRIDPVGDSGKSVKVTALSKGTARITAVATDGSGKSATVTVTVNQPAVSIEVSGQAYIHPGGKATYKATVLPADANNKKIKWEVGEYAGSGNPLKSVPGVSISTGGIVRVGKNVSYDGNIYVRATSQEDSSIYNETFFSICSGVTYVTLDNAEKKASEDWTVLAPVNIGKYKNTLTLEGSAIVPGEKISRRVGITSSNPSVVSVEELVYDSTTGKTQALLKARKKGKAIITCSALDGSKKSKKLSLRVVIPASGLTLSLKDNLTTSLAYGGSAVVCATAGRAYGIPDNQKVEWDYDIIAYKSSGGYVKLSEENPSLLNSIKATGSFFKFSNGKIKVNSEEDFKRHIEEYGYDSSGTKIYQDFGLKVIAETADGSGFRKESNPLRAISPGTYIDFKQYIAKDESGKKYTLSEDATNTIVISLSDTRYNPTLVNVSYDSTVSSVLKNAFITKSSKTSVASAYCGTHSSSGITGLIIYPYRTGISYITLTMRDGSGFKKTLKVKVVK